MAVRNNKPDRASAIEAAKAMQAADPRLAAFNYSPEIARGVAEYQNQGNATEFESFLAPFNNPYRNATAPKSGRFFEQNLVFGRQAGGVNPTYEDLQVLAQKAKAAGYDVTLYSKTIRGEATVSIDYDPDTDFTGAIAPGVPLSDYPTSSSNFKRPATVAAGYDPEKRIITVVFRNGTFYNYYDVPEDVWIKFHSSISKGQFLYDTTGAKNPEKPTFKGDLLNYAHGVADMSEVAPAIQQTLYAAARVAQIYYGTKTKTPAAPQNPRAKRQPNLRKAASANGKPPAQNKSASKPKKR
jgi:hypothetical protein